METGPVSRPWMTEAFRGLGATLERLRVDRQLDEALARGPDPLHSAAIFGLDDKTAIRYAHAARQLLESQAERDSDSDAFVKTNRQPDSPARTMPDDDQG